MPLVITEEQSMLKTSAKEFLKEKAPVANLRALRDERSAYGYDPKVWAAMAEMGWASLTIPEAYGGLDFGYTGLGQILEETGRTLTASPLVSTALIGTTLLNQGANVLQKEALLPAIAEGKLLLSLATEETQAHKPAVVNAKYRVTSTGFSITGTKLCVLDGHVANKLIVSARKNSKSGISLFLVDAKAKGVSIERTFMMDSRNAANITLKSVKVKESDLIGTEGEGLAILEKTMDIARIGLAAEMLGTMQEAFERTVAYLKERQQFGVPIGVFQGLQHRAAHMYCEIENCKSVVIAALQAVDADSPKVPMLASLAKAKLGEVLQLVTNEAIQMFGGIGMTDDEEIGFFLKRARVVQQTLGDYNYHLDRYAKMNGY